MTRFLKPDIVYTGIIITVATIAVFFFIRFCIRQDNITAAHYDAAHEALITKQDVVVDYEELVITARYEEYKHSRRAIATSSWGSVEKSTIEDKR